MPEAADPSSHADEPPESTPPASGGAESAAEPVAAGQPVASSQPVPVSELERSKLLDTEIERYVRAGFRVVSRSPTTAQLVRPKSFNIGCALLGFFVLLAGLLLYLIYYASKRDSTVYLTIDEYGVIHRQVAGDVPTFAPTFTAQGELQPRPFLSGNNRLQCPACGYENSPNRQSCKRCRTPLFT